MEIKLSRSNWKDIITAIVVAVLVITLLRDCSEKKRIAKAPDPTIKIVEIEKDAKKWIDSLKVVKTKLDSVQAAGKKTEARLVKSQGEVKTWIGRYESARQYNDTLGAILACDSLVNENVKLNAVIDENREEIRRKDSAWAATLSASDSVAAKQTRIASEMRIAAQNATAERNKIAVDFNKQNKKLRNAQAREKILAIGLGIAIGVVTLK